MVVYIFPSDETLDVLDFTAKFNARGLTIMTHQGRNYNEGTTKIYKRLEDGTEEIIGDSIIKVDEELGFEAEDIVDDWRFGNGTTIGQILLKDKRIIKCGWVVIDHANINAANGMIVALRNIFKGKPQ